MKPQNILIVDDEPVNVKILKAMLSPEGYQILTASSGPEALVLVDENLPDIILLDVMMPEMDGFEVCRRIKTQENLRVIPVLMVTALQDKIHRQKAMEAGADDFLSKPIDRIELLIRVKSLLRIKQYSDEQLESLKLLKQKNRQLEELERVKDGLTNMIIHDLRGPLTSISMNIDLSLMKLRQDVHIKKFLHNAGSYCIYLNEMIEGLLEVHKMEEGKIEIDASVIDPPALFSEIVEQYRPQIEAKQIALSCNICPDAPALEADYRLIRRVIGNLLDNAIRHTPCQGKIEISFGPEPSGEGILVKISDNGQGIQEKYRCRIFDKFEQVKLKKKGVSTGSVGLGLAFCKMAVELHGGKIGVEDGLEGKGCSFFFTLPLKPAGNNGAGENSHARDSEM